MEDPLVLASQNAAIAANLAKDVAQRASDGLSDIGKQLQVHTASDELHFQAIYGKLEVIKDNHLFHIEKDMTAVVSSVASLHEKLDANSRETIENKTSMGWIVKIGGGAWAVALILFGTMVYIVREAVIK